MGAKELEQFNKNQAQLENLWACYRQFLKDTGYLDDSVAQFLAFLERTDWISKDDFRFLG